MQLEDYFDFLTPDDIRIKGTRVGIETVLFDYIHRNRTPDEIVRSYPSLSLEQVHATIVYYLHNKDSINAYLEDWIEFGRRAQEDQERNPPPSMLRLRVIRKQLEEEKSKKEQEAMSVKAQ